FTFRRAGRYRVRVTAAADQAGDELAKLRLELAERQTVVEVAATQDEPQEYTWELMVEAGQRDLSVTFFNDYYNPRAADPAQRDRNMYVHAVQVTGPVDVSAEDLPASHKRLIIAT